MKENNELNIINIPQKQIIINEKKENFISEIDLFLTKYQNIIENNNQLNFEDILKYCPGPGIKSLFSYSIFLLSMRTIYCRR